MRHGHMAGGCDLWGVFAGTSTGHMYEYTDTCWADSVST